MVRYLEDFEPGQKFGSGRLSVEAERIKSFAAEFDPQPFHLNEDSARETFFNGLAASGWHTAAMTMRLLVESGLKPAAASSVPDSTKCAGRDPCGQATSCMWKAKYLEVRPSKSRPDQGLIKVRTTTLNQNNEPVQVFVGNLIVLRRPKSSGKYMAKLDEKIARSQSLAAGGVLVTRAALLEGPIARTLLGLAWPVLAVLALQTFVGVAETYFEQYVI